MSISYLNKLWAKSDPYHPLWCHCLDVAAVAKALILRFGPLDSMPDGWIEYLCGTHDVGKADPHFQNKSENLAVDLRELGLIIPLWDATEIDGKKLFRHEERSREWLLADLEKRGWNKFAAIPISHAIAGHHGDWKPVGYPAREGPQFELWEKLRDELGELLWATIQPMPYAPVKLDHASATGAKLAAYVVISDWIASNDALFPYPTLTSKATPAEYYSASCELAKRVVAQLKLDAPVVDLNVPKPLFNEMWTDPKFQPPRPLQQELEDRRDVLKRGLAIIEAPMGEGKTEAAIYLAQLWANDAGARGTYFALPTQATANAMYKRYWAFLKNWKPERDARLMHGMAWLRDDQTPPEVELLPQIEGFKTPEAKRQAVEQARSARNWFRPSRRALLGLEAVGTVDQALLAALRVKFGPLRLLGLSQKVLVIDEVHAYDEFMSAIMERLLQWCAALDIGVILLSATLSQEQRLTLCRAYAGKNVDLAPLQTGDATQAPYPLLTFISKDETPLRIATEADPNRAQNIAIVTKDGYLGDAIKTAELARQTVSEGGCLCVLCNTVKSAQETFEQLRAFKDAGQLPDCELMLFHARFRTERRGLVEGEVVGRFGPDAGKEGEPMRPQRAILVATQVVEQSLDVDFDWMISEIAPVDLLLQRAGRLWRHARPNRLSAAPQLVVLTPEAGVWNFGSSAKVYTAEILLRTRAICQKFSLWKLPEHFRVLIETCYRRDLTLGDFALRNGFEKALADGEIERDKERNKAISEAGIHLWLEPSPKNFDPTRNPVAEAEEENNETSRYFAARTRLGDDSMPCLVLSKPKHFELRDFDFAQASAKRGEQKSPPRSDLIEIFNEKVSLPRWWFTDVKPLEGFEEITKGETFLRGHQLLPMRLIDGQWQWRGQTSKGQFAIIDDEHLGLRRIALGDEPDSFPEADAGATGV